MALFSAYSLRVVVALNPSSFSLLLQQQRQHRSLSSLRRIAFLGTPQIAVEALEILYRHSDPSSNSNSIQDSLQQQQHASVVPFVISVVVAQPGDIGSKTTKKSPVQVFAEKHNIPVYTPEKASDPTFLAALEKMELDLCITAAYGNYLPKKFLSIPKFGTINIHPSLLPKYRGAAPIQRCLENGDTVTGVSVLETVAQMDAGPILSQTTRVIQANDSSTTLLVELFQTGAKEILRLLPSIFDPVNHPLKKIIQDDSLHTLAPKIASEESYVDFNSMSATTIHNRQKGFDFGPGVWSSFVFFSEGDFATMTAPMRIKLLKTVVLSSTSAGFTEENYRVVEFVRHEKHGHMLQVNCGDGSVLGILELQPAGKNRMSARDFANGFRGRSLLWSQQSH